MSSIASDPRGHKRLIVIDAEGDRRTIRLGKCGMRTAERARLHIDMLLGAKRNGGIPDDDTLRWLDEIGNELHNRLAALGLCADRGARKAQLGPFIDQYVMDHPGKFHTDNNMLQVRKWLCEHLGEDRDLRTVSVSDAQDWRAWVRGKLSENTIRRHVGRARQLWKHAIKRGVAHVNVWEGMSAQVKSDKSRLRFIDRATTEKLIAACPDAEWRLLVALARYGGLRIPSEIRRMKWDDVDWKRGRLLVHSPKTEHHEGKEERIIPLFPELREHFQNHARENNDPSPFIFPASFRDPTVNLRSRFGDIVKAAGLTAWPKPWHNLRASLETELTEQYPIQVVCAWIGNTPRIAQDHYLMVLDKFFDIAAGGLARPPARHTSPPSDTEHAPQNDTGENTGELVESANINHPRQGQKLSRLTTENGLLTQLTARRAARRARVLRHLYTRALSRFSTSSLSPVPAAARAAGAKGDAC